jgi:hypothetical protein
MSMVMTFPAFELEVEAKGLVGPNYVILQLNLQLFFIMKNQSNLQIFFFEMLFFPIFLSRVWLS